MQTLDWLVLALYFLVMVAIGVWSYRRVHSSQDFFAAGGKMPWWLAGISHHVSGYSAVAFTGYAAVAYTEGFTLYIWWAVTVAIAMLFGAILIAPRWARLRRVYGVESPLEYLKTRYNIPTQQLLAWSGSLLKIFDVGAKYASIAIFLDILAGVPLYLGVILAGLVSLVYVTIGGLWADALNDLGQFIVQILATTVLFAVVLAKLGGVGAIFGMWERLPEGHTSLFAGEYTPTFVLAFLLITFLSYSGGTWNLAQRFIASPMGSDARKAAFLSAGLYLTLPLAMFFPMWAAPIFLPNIANPEEVYGIMAREFLPPGMVGLVLAGMFAATMSMTASDSNAVSAVATRDMLPVIFRSLRNMSEQRGLLIGRVTTFLFTALTLIVAIYADAFGGIIGLVVVWFAGLLGPTAIPMILGLLPVFRHSGPTTAIASTLAGVATFAVANFIFQGPFVATTGLPVVVSAVIFVGGGLLNRQRAVSPEVDDMLESISADRSGRQPETAVTATGSERGS